MRAGAALDGCRSRWEALLGRPSLAVGMIVVLGLLLRGSLIAANRFHADEALYSYWGLLIASGRDVWLRTQAVDKPPVFFYTLALSFKLFGPTETAARLPNLMASVANIAIVYHLGWQVFRDRRTAALAALFLALSPYDIQFAPTAFTDPLMVTLACASLLLALRGRSLPAGLLWGLAVMTKPTAILVLPLLLLVVAGRPIGADRRDLRRGALAMGLGLGVIVIPVAIWDLLLRTGVGHVLRISAEHYGGLSWAPLAALPARVAGWLALLPYFTGSRPLNTLLLAGVPALLLVGMGRRKVRAGWAAERVLACFLAGYVAIHSLLALDIWDRYLLGLAPIVALLSARVVLLPYNLLTAPAANAQAVAPPSEAAPGWKPWREPRWQAKVRSSYSLLLGPFLLVTLLPAVSTALHYGFPLGSEHGAFQGIEEVAAYLRGNAPPGAVVFHRTLGWHLSFYTFDQPIRLWYAPDDETLLRDAERMDEAKYIVFPSWIPSEDLAAYLHAHGWALRKEYRTYRRDGTVSFTIYRIEAGQAPEQPSQLTRRTASAIIGVT